MAPAEDRAAARPATASGADQWARARTRWSTLGPSLAGFALPFLLVVYLALKGGGYDPIVRGEIGIAVWWIVLIGAAAGALPATRVTRAGWVGLGAFAAFAAWTTLGIAWSESAERSVAEMGRLSAYLGVFVLAAFAQGREGLRRTVQAVAVGIGLIGVLALLSRLHPSWFPANETARILEGSEARLNYPLNYWNAVSTLMAIGIPMLLAIGAQARFVASRAVAVAAIPALSLAAFYTLSRGGALEIAFGVTVLMVLYPRRLAALPGLMLAAAGSALLIAAAAQRDALEAGLGNASALSQGDEMLLISVVVCAGVGLVQAAFATASRYGLGPRLNVPRRVTALIAAVGATLVVAIGLAAGGGGYLSDRWQEFKTPAPEASTDAARYESFSGSGRYELWESAVDANQSASLLGIGPGTYEFWWSRNGAEGFGFVRDAHSLYLETLAELGIIGLILLVAFVLSVLAFGVARLIRPGDSERRGMLAAAVAGASVFAVAAGVDWMWEIPVLPVIFLMLAAAIFSPSAESRRGRTSSRFGSRLGVPYRAVITGVALAGVVSIAIPLAGAESVRDSQDAVRRGQIPTALQDARDASSVQPYAATPELQQAMVLELAGDLPAALSAAEEATDAEPTNWRNWLVLSRLEAKSGNAEASVRAYRQARELNPRSILFQ
ncbi:MAG: O-antigen ligase family protein [Solirubrobacterales bacterium]|nr:O-antigen ligase family protein [Solirubrobacterales bacterium]